VVAKDDRTREGLKAQLAEHSVERAYLALTIGVPRTGAIRTTHTRDPKSRLRFTSRSKEGRLAVTHVRVLESLAGGRAALVECRLETGRTHQIRVHLSEQTKTPLLADALYGRPPAAPDLAEIAQGLGRQALHAAVLGFIHPISAERLRFEVPPPPDFARALAALRALG
jgi:23S rRNA pseudouridine1911/1915/1917 synthase